MKVQTQTITTYVANDGTSFATPDECQMYEKSNIALYKRIAVEQEFMSYCPDYDELSSCGCENSDLTEAVKSYACRIINDALEMKKAGKTQNEIMVEFGLVSKK